MAELAKKKKQLDDQRPRRRRPRITVRKVEEEKPKGNELAAFILGAFGLFLLFAIASHIEILYRADNLSPEVLARENVMGLIGYRIARLLFRTLGWCSLATVLWAWLLARSMWRGTYQSSAVSFIQSSIGSVIMAVSAATIASLFYDGEGGGVVGLRLSSLLVPFLNKGGTILIAGFLLIISFVFSTGVKIGELLGAASTTSKKLGKGAAVGLSATGKVSGKAVKLQIGFTKSLATVMAGIFRKRQKREEPLRAYAFEDGTPDWGDEVEEEEFVFDGLPKKTSRTEAAVPAANNIIPLLPAPEDEEENGKKKTVAGPKLTLRDRLKKKKQAVKVKQDFDLPPLDILQLHKSGEKTHPKDDELLKNCKQLEKTLLDFKVGGKIVEVQPGPVITLYEFEPAPGVKVQRVVTLADDLALALRVASVRVYAPVPGKGTVGIEVPNAKREIVALREILDSERIAKEEASLTLALGKDTFGDPFAADLEKMPHLLIAGATGTGKSVCINSILLSLLYRNSPEDLRFILIDPKMLELSVYEQIPHLKAPVVTNPKRARGVLWWAVEEMERRYRLMMDLGVRNLDGYNRKIDEDGPSAPKLKETPSGEEEFAGEVISKLPHIVIVVDELADLMLTVGREVEELLTRLAQKARAAGIHLILATQRPSVNVITGLIKANFPSRISFKVASRIDSRTVLDGSGAEKLLGQGDMLYVSSGAGRPKRLHGAFVSDKEVHEVVKWWRAQGAPDYDPQIEEMIKRLNESESEGGFAPDGEFEYDPLYDQALQLVVEKGQASTSMVQRVFRIGYNRAARILEMMEREGVVGPADGAKPRQVFAPKV